MPANKLGTLEARLGGIIPFDGYEEVSMKATFKQPEYDSPGNLDVAFRYVLKMHSFSVLLQGTYNLDVQSNIIYYILSTTFLYLNC